MNRPPPPAPASPLWYKDAVIYELHVRAFHDSNGDGIGDFPGLLQKLPYLRNLGVDTLWLLPFYPSPLRDDGYDISDYRGVHPAYGTLADFRRFLEAAHGMGLRVITELVLNHTSDQHPWFQRARRAPPGSRWRRYYVWSDTPDRYREARIIFKDAESSNWAWDPAARAYYWHRFYAHQPDLNLESPDVRREILRTVDFWLGMGVDGLRLDAIPYLYEREGTSCENLPETHAFLKELRAHVDGRFRDRVLLAEANQWPEDAAAYFGNGDECHMAFHFPIMPRMFMAVHMEDRYPLVDILSQTPPIPPSCQWALFLRNHDELTLEMVTDEERDYMYRVYAHDPRARLNLGIRRRLAPLLQNNRRKIELLNGLLFSLPGTPILYYGDEIGMGDNIYLGDRNGVRTPMQWSADRNAGFSRAGPQRLYLPIGIDPEYHYEAVNVEAQENNPHSLLWWMKRLIALSRRHRAFGRGSMEVLAPENRKIFAYVRSHERETILAVANLSRFVQYVELDLARFKGCVPVELFGLTEFPPVGEAPYLLTLGPHAFYWFLLEPLRPRAAEVRSPAEERTIPVPGGWEDVFRDHARAGLEEALVFFLPGQRWFSGKGRAIKAVRLETAVPFRLGGIRAAFALVQVEFTEGDAQRYALPLAFAAGERAEQARRESPERIIALLRTHAGGHEVPGVLYDAAADPAFGRAILEGIARRRLLGGDGDRLALVPTPPFRSLRGPGEEPLPASPSRAEQSHSSLFFGQRLVLKLLRRVEPGTNPELEMGRFLSERTAFPGTAPVGGFVELRRPGAEPYVLAILSGFVPNQGDAWSFILDELGRYFETVLSRPDPPPADLVPRDRLLQRIQGTPPAVFLEVAGSCLEVARLLGRRTAELHAALASDREDPDFAPEPDLPHHRRSVFQSLRNRVAQVFPLLRRRFRDLPEAVRPDAQKVLEAEAKILERYRALAAAKFAAQRLRIHGDLHLGQVLYTGKDYVFVDFEGEPGRPMSERRIKRSPLRDVAGMIRSFDYAAQVALHDRLMREETPPDRRASLETAARLWQAWVASAYLRAYLDRAGAVPWLPDSREATGLLLDAFLLDKAVYELNYELHHRPLWVRIPLRGILNLLEP